MLEVREVITKQELNWFISFPDRLYKNNSYRVTPLHQIERATLDKNKNPAFDYCTAKYWLAFRNDEIVGRIAGVINHKSNELREEKYLRFGWFDFIDDPGVSEKLLGTVEQWALQNNMDHVHGPLGFSDMDLEGMLVQGFEEMGTQAVLYNFPYYPQHLENLGYRKDVDWLQFEIKVPDSIPEKITRVSKLVKEKYNLKVLKAKSAKDLLPYADKMFDTLNASFTELYGFVPLSDRQKKYYTKQYFSLIDPKYVCFILDPNNNVAGFGLSIPSLSKALIKAKGRLFPFGFIGILKALKKNDTVDMLLQGVNLKYKNKGLPAVFYEEMMRSYIDNGIKTAVSSHALEHNTAAFSMFADFENRNHLRRRCYVKQINN